MADKKPPGFMIYEEFARMILNLPPEKAGELIQAAIRYNFDEVEPDTDDLLIQTLFIGIKEYIDNNKDKYKSICERNANNIRKRWNTKNTSGKSGIPNDTKNTNITKQNITKQNETKQNETKTEKEIYKEKDAAEAAEDADASRSPAPEKQKRKIFKKPTVEEIRAYCSEKNYNINAESFFDYYESNGWKVGNHPMKNWQAAVRTWVHRDNEQHSQGQPRGKGMLTEEQVNYIIDNTPETDIDNLPF